MTPAVTIIAKTGCKLCSSLREKMELLKVPCYYISYASSFPGLPESILYFDPANDFKPVSMTWREAPVIDAVSTLVMDPTIDIDHIPTPTAIFEGRVYTYAGVIKAIRDHQACDSNTRKVS